MEKESLEAKVKKISEKMEEADAIIIGAGSGLSTSTGYTYTGDRFKKYFSDFEAKYGFHDMYSGGFCDYENLETMWAYWSRYIFLNRYTDVPGNLYTTLFNLVKNKNYFILTTNVDHCFQKSGFDRERMFYTQGDYGLFQCSVPCHHETYDNEKEVCDMVKEQGYEIKDHELIKPENVTIKMQVPSNLIPHCPKCGKPMSMNLRADDTFVEDEGWYRASDRYESFLKENKNKKVLFLELGVGYNTPGIIKYPFWQYTFNWPLAFYVCLNKGQAQVPDDIKHKSICINDDINQVLEMLEKQQFDEIMDTGLKQAMANESIPLEETFNILRSKI